jgi:hypothetical protein
MFVTRITRYRELAAGAAMIGFAAALELEDLVDPTNVGSTSDRLQRVAEHPTRLVVASALLFLSSALLIPTLATLRGLVRERRLGHRLMAAATAVWTLGALGHAAEVGYYAVVGAAASHQTPQVLATLNGAGGDPAGAVIGIGIACFALGCFLTIGALVRSGIASRWLLLAIVAGIVGQPLGKAIGIRAFDLGQLAAVAPLLWVGWRLMSPTHDTSPETPGHLEPALES